MSGEVFDSNVFDSGVFDAATPTEGACIHMTLASPAPSMTVASPEPSLALEEC